MGKRAGVAMNIAQVAGMVVTIAVVVGVDLRLDWLVPLAMLCGGAATFFVGLWQQTRG